MPSLYESLNPDAPKAIGCAYVSKAGTPCTRIPVEGEETCVLHGASVALAKDQVQRRMVALQEKSVAVLEDILVSGYDDKTRLAAVVAILDRTGLGPKSTITVEKSDDLRDLPLESIAAELDGLTKRAKDELNRRRMNEAMMTKNSVRASDTKH